MTDFQCIIWKVEHGSSALAITPNMRTIMLDAGCSENFSPALHIKNVFGIERIDKLIISHPDRDHIQDLPRVYAHLKPRMISRNKAIPVKDIYPSGTSNLQEPLLTYKKMDEEYTRKLTTENMSEPISNWGYECLVSEPLRQFCTFS